MERLAGTVIVLAFAACGGGGKATPGPLAAQACPDPSPKPEASRAELEHRIAVLEAELAKRPPMASRIEGPALTVQAAKPGDPPVKPLIDETEAVAASKAFLGLVAGSRDAIQNCYQKALKLNTALAARTVNLTISASFTGAGAYKSSATSPSLGNTFDNCMKNVMTVWSLRGISGAMTFKAEVELTP